MLAPSKSYCLSSLVLDEPLQFSCALITPYWFSIMKIGINGFGKIGSLVAFVALQRDDFEIAAINDPFIDTNYMVVMFPSNYAPGITVKDSKTLLFGEKPVPVFAHRNPEEIPQREAAAHLKASAKKSLILFPLQAAQPTALLHLRRLFTMNLALLRPEGHVTTFYSITSSLMNVEWPPIKKWKRPRASQLDILSSCTGSAKSVGKEATYDQIKAAIKKESQGKLKGILGYVEDAVYTRDFVVDSRSSIFCAKAGIGLSKNLVKLVALYGNEWGYSTRVVDLIAHMAKAQEN
ncbi:hypothetical protein K1719_020049 [Acacia pycnantha]|nr:hypothetical protein K1719_020049 [Acacia pycnantha]